MTKGFDKCIAQMKAAAGKVDGQDVLSNAKAGKILKALAEDRKSSKKNGIVDPDLDFLDRVEKMVAAEQTSAIIEKRNAALNMLRKKEFFDYAKNFKDDHDALQAFLAGIAKPVEGARSSVATRQQAMFNQYMKGMLNDLEKDGLLPHFQDAKNGRDIAIELFELDGTTGGAGRTNNTAAIKIAKVVRKFQDELVSRQNKAGAWIQKLPGYIVSQSHDMGKVRAATFEEWRDFILDKLDLDATFGGLPQEKWNEMLLESYKGITSGRHMTAAGSLEADGLVGFKGSSSIGRKVSEHRVLHFNGPESFVEYNDRFGSGSVQGSILKGVDRASKNIALMEKMGPNPQAFYDTIKSQLLDRNKSNLPVFDKIQGKQAIQNIVGDTTDNLMKELMGETSLVQSLTWARINQGLRQWTNMVSLGGSIFSQLPDLASKASELRFQGRHPLEGYRQAFTDIFVGKGNKEQQRIAQGLGAGFEGVLNESIGRFMTDDGLPGQVSEASRLFFKLNFMEYWNEAHKMGMARSMSAFLASHSDLPYDQLHIRTQEVMKLYGIKDAEWEVIKKAKTKVGDYEYILPELITDQKIRTQFDEYMADRIDYGVLTPGVRERAIAHKGTQAGTFEGELFRHLSQFKLFAISMVSKLLPREFQGMGKPDVFGIVQLMTGATVLGYLSMSAKDIVKGRKPRPLEDPRTWKAALLQGGGLGIYGDFLFGEYDRYGGGFMSTMAGPTLSKGDPLMRMYSQALKGKLDASEIFQFVKNNTPFLNLFYLRSALDYLFLYDIQESMNPGFLRRMERRIMDEQGQEFILPPSQNPGLLRQ